MTKAVADGTAHQIPKDLKDALIADQEALDLWQNLTPLARNEWICWVTFVKKETTRNEHVQRTVNELKEGIKRPCCWIGCIHRKDKAISPSIAGMLAKRLRKES